MSEYWGSRCDFMMDGTVRGDVIITFVDRFEMLIGHLSCLCRPIPKVDEENIPECPASCKTLSNVVQSVTKV